MYVVRRKANCKTYRKPRYKEIKGLMNARTKKTLHGSHPETLVKQKSKSTGKISRARLSGLYNLVQNGDRTKKIIYYWWESTS